LRKNPGLGVGKMFRLTNKIKILIVSLACIGVSIISIYFHLLGIDKISPHFYYIPILLLACWWGYPGWYLGILFALTLPAIHIASGIDAPVLSDIIGVAVMCAVSGVVAGGVEKFKKVETELKEARGRFEALFENANELIITTDANGYVLRVNKKIEEISGYSRQELIGESILKIAYPEDRDKYIRFWKDILYGLIPQYELRALTKKGYVADLLASGSAIRRGDEIIEIQYNAQDITERKDVEKALKESEEKYRTILESIEEGYYEVDIKGTFTFFNDSMCKIFGYAKDEVMGMSYRRFMNKKNAEDVFKTFNNVYRTGRVTRALDWEIIRKDGSKCFVEASISIIKDSKGQPIVFRGVVRDITERKKAEAKLIEAKARFEALFENANEMVFTTDAKGYILRVNKKMEEVTGYSRKELIGKSALILATPEYRGEYISHLKEVLEGTLSYHEQEGLTKDNRIFNVIIHASVVEKDGQISEIQYNVQDITELKQKEDRIKQANKDLQAALNELKETQARLIQQEKMASIGYLAAGMAHEINNPLGFINSNLGTFKRYMEYTKGFLGFVKESALNTSPAEKKSLEDAWSKNKIDMILEDSGDLLSESMDGTDRIREIVANLKEFSHIDKPDLTEISLNKMLDTVVDIVKQGLSDHIDIVKDYGDIPLIDGYGSHLSQAFMAILTNAIWAIEGSGTVTIKTRGAKDSVQVIISDTGCGIPEEGLSKIFDPFFTTKEVGKGKGLGLNTAYRVISSHGGKIDTETKVGKGTIFTITLPVRQ